MIIFIKILLSDPEEAKIMAKFGKLNCVYVLISEIEWLNHLETSYIGSLGSKTKQVNRSIESLG